MKITFILLLFSSLFISAQRQDLSELYEVIGKPVVINKKVVSYVVSHVNIQNGKRESMRSMTPSEKNPFNIFISSDNNGASIRINNKNLREDLFLQFKKIYKVVNKDSSSDEYKFTSEECGATYYVPKDSEEHQYFIVDCENSKGNGMMLHFTISQLDEL